MYGCANETTIIYYGTEELHFECWRRDMNRNDLSAHGYRKFTDPGRAFLQCDKVLAVWMPPNLSQGETCQTRTKFVHSWRKISKLQWSVPPRARGQHWRKRIDEKVIGKKEHDTQINPERGRKEGDKIK